MTNNTPGRYNVPVIRDKKCSSQCILLLDSEHVWKTLVSRLHYLEYSRPSLIRTAPYLDAKKSVRIGEFVQITEGILNMCIDSCDKQNKANLVQSLPI